MYSTFSDGSLVIALNREEYDSIRVLLSQYPKATLSITELSDARELDGILRDAFKKFHPDTTARYGGFTL